MGTHFPGSDPLTLKSFQTFIPEAGLGARFLVCGMSEIHYGGERRPEQGGDNRPDTVSDHALSYGVCVACTVEVGRASGGYSRYVWPQSYDHRPVQRYVPHIPSTFDVSAGFFVIDPTYQVSPLGGKTQSSYDDVVSRVTLAHRSRGFSFGQISCT